MTAQTATGRRKKRIANRDRAAVRVAHLQARGSFEAPELELSPDALRSVWTEEPAAVWDDIRLTQLVESTIAIWSYVIGVQATERRGVPTTARQAALAATTGWVTPGPAAANSPVSAGDATARLGAPQSPSLEPELRAPYAAAGTELVAKVGGWGGGVMSWRKLCDYGPISLDLDAGIALPHELRLANDRDYASLDVAWQQVAQSLHRCLPAPVLTAFLAGPRIVEQVRLPGVLEATALLLSWGPFGARRAMVRSLQSQGASSGPRASTLLNYATMLDSLARAAQEVSNAYPILRELGWHEHWNSLKTDARTIKTREGHRRARDTSSPGQLQARRSLRLWERRVDSHRRQRDGSLRPSAGRDLANFTLDTVHLSTSGRIGMTSEVAPIHVVRRGVYGDYVGPLIWVAVNKNGSLALEPRPVHVLVIDTVDEYCDFFDIPRDDVLPLWRDGDGEVLNKGTLLQRFSRKPTDRVPALFQRADGSAASSHRGRNLGDNLIRAIATRIVAARPELAGRIDPAAAADVWLSHQIRSDRYGYQDVKNNRDWWAIRIGAGDPEYGIPGLGDLLFGDAGARRGWDTEAVIDTLRRSDTAREAAREAESRVAAVRADRERLLGQPLRISPRSLEAAAPGEALLQELDETRPATAQDLEQLRNGLSTLITESHAVQVELADEVARVSDERARQRARIDAELDRLVDVRAERQLELDRAGLELERQRERGRTLPLADELPTTAELRAASGDPEARALDDESWTELLARAGGEERQSGRIRVWLNVTELSLLFGVDSVTILRWRCGLGSSEIGRGVARATWCVMSAKLAFVKADTLPLHLFLPSQQQLVEQLLAEPMGGNGGRRRTDAEIEETHKGDATVGNEASAGPAAGDRPDPRSSLWTDGDLP